jgi:hypothetical protein
MAFLSQKELFENLFFASTESEVDKEIVEHPLILGNPANWSPLDSNESNFGVIENQQSSPVAALIEKITNSIDAILMRKCFEASFLTVIATIGTKIGTYRV